MPDISTIGHGHGSVGPIDRPGSTPNRHEAAPASKPESPPQRPGDRIELSDHARFLDRLRRLPAGRLTEVDRIRDAIAQGTYESDEKLSVAVDRLLEDLLND